MKNKFSFVDFLLIVISVFMAVVASPYVIRQFLGLVKPGDILWNVSLDIVLVSIYILIVYIIDKVLNRFLP